jgi:hypothetical protein
MFPRERLSPPAVARGYRHHRNAGDYAGGLEKRRRRDSRRAQNSHPQRLSGGRFHALQVNRPGDTTFASPFETGSFHLSSDFATHRRRRIRRRQFSKIANSMEGQKIRIVLVVRATEPVVVSGARHRDQVVTFDLPIDVLKTVLLRIRMIQDDGVNGPITQVKRSR